MSVTDIISLSAEKAGSSYLRIIIEGQPYSEGFRDLAELQRYFKTIRPRHFRGVSLPVVVRETKPVEVFGNNKTHKVIAVLNENGDSIYHLVGGPSGHLWDRTFTDPDDAADFARLQAARYDQE